LLSWKTLENLRSGLAPNFAIAASLGCITSLDILRYLVVALIQPWDFHSRGPSSTGGEKIKKQPPARDTVFSRLKFGYETAYSNRHCNTPFEVSKTPHFSGKDPSYVPSKVSWLFSTSLYILFAYLMLDSMSLSHDPVQTEIMFSHSKVPFFTRLHEITIEECIQRLVAVTTIGGFGIPVVYLLMRIPAFLFVALGVQKAEQFPPLFNFNEGFPWSVSRFWTYVSLIFPTLPEHRTPLI
jgi:hypothetical protein